MKEEENHTNMIASYLLVMLAGCLWGCMGTVYKGMQAFGVSSAQAAACRMLVASFLIGLWFLFRDRSAFRVTWKQLLALFISGGVGSGIYNLTYFMAVEETAVSFASAMSYTAPAFVTIFSLFLFREKLTGQKVVSLALMLVGCVFVTGVLQATGVHYSLKGTLLGLASGLAYSLYSLFLRMAILQGCSSKSASFYCVLFAYVVVAPFGDMGGLVPKMADPKCLLLGLALGALCAAAPSVLYSMGMSRVESSKAAMIATVDLVVATILGVVLFRDPLSAMQIAGIVLIFASVMILSYKKKEEPPHEV